MTLLEEAAIEIESVADDFRGRCHAWSGNWADKAEEAEYDRLMDLVRRLREADK